MIDLVSEELEDKALIKMGQIWDDTESVEVKTYDQESSG